MKTLRRIAILSAVLCVPPAHAQEGAASDPLAPPLGTLAGRFIFDGARPKPPEPSWLDGIKLEDPLRRDNVGRWFPADVAYREYLEKGVRPTTRDDSLLVGEDLGLANVVVYVTSADIPLPAEKPGKVPGAVLQIKDGQFAPRVTTLVPNQSLEIKNLDPVDFTISFREFRNPIVYRKVGSRASEFVTLADPEPFPKMLWPQSQNWAKGYLFVHANPYVAVSAADGGFSIPDLPLGKWEFRAWHEKCGFLSRNWPKGRFAFDIKPGSNNLGDLLLSPDAFMDRHDAAEGQPEPGVGADSR